MSIIHEALKKVDASAHGPAPAYRRGGGKGLLFFILFVIISVLFAGYMYLRIPPTEVAAVALPPPPPPPAQEVKTIAPAVEAAPVPAPKPETPPVFKVQGIMADPKGNVALINDKVYAEGDDLDGARILRIGLDAIVVSRDGKEETIPARH